MRRAALLALVAILVLAGCGDDDEAAVPAAAPLPDTPWTLTAGIDVAGWEDVAPSATFANGRVSGTTGCNRYTAPYTVEGDTLTVGDAAVTRMACAAPGDAVESAFLDALGQVHAWRLDGDALVLTADDDAELLRFGPPPRPTGTWTATGIRGADAVSSPVPGTEVTATFAEGGKLTGSAGCNSYSATYRAEAGAITIEPPVATRMACSSPPGVMEQERDFLAALELAAGYELEGSRLSLLTAEGTFAATFEQAGPR